MSAANANITTSFSVTIGSETDASVSAEIDTRSLAEGGINAKRLGKTENFTYNDTVYVIVYGIVDPKDVVLSYTLSSFSNSGLQLVRAPDVDITGVSVKETLKFGNGQRTATLSKPTLSTKLVPCRWYGNRLADELNVSLTTVSLPPIKPNINGGIEAEKEANKLGNAVVQYFTPVSFFKFTVPVEEIMKKHGKPPYEIDFVILFKKNETLEC